MALAPRTVQNKPERFNRDPMTALQPASTTPDPTKTHRAEGRVAHAFGIRFEVLRLGQDFLRQVGLDDSLIGGDLRKARRGVTLSSVGGSTLPFPAVKAARMRTAKRLGVYCPLSSDLRPEDRCLSDQRERPRKGHNT